jgi:cytochrome oxidase Cu insertion factor (SCO1/SenC/PrrC family)
MNQKRKIAQVSSMLVLSALFLSGCGSTSNTSSGSPKKFTLPEAGQGAAAPMGGTYLNQKLPAPVLALPLVDSNGEKISLGSLAGKTVILANFLTSCQEICPMVSANMRDLADAISGSELKGNVEVLEVSVDAGMDKPARLRVYQALYGEKSWTLATGSEEALKALWSYFGAPATKTVKTASDAANAPTDWQTGKPITYDYVHADIVLIINPDSTWSWMDLAAPQTVAKKVPAKMQSFLSDEGQTNLSKPDAFSWSVDTVLAALSQLTGVSIKV